MTTVRDEKVASDLDARLQNFDIFNDADEQAKWEIFAHSRHERPVARTEQNGGFWLITRYEDVRYVVEDWETFSSLESSPVQSPMRLCPIDSDPPIHTHARNLLNTLFSRNYLLRFEPDMRATAKDLISKWVDRGSFEVISEFSGPYVGALLAKIVFNDIPDEEMRHAQQVAIRASEDASPETFIDLAALCQTNLDRARGKTDLPEGVLKELTTGKFGDRPLTEEEQLGVLGILFLGGLGTTRQAIAGIAYRTAINPGTEERLRDPKWVRADLDEFLRLDSPVGCFARVATRDVELQGVTIKAGERVLVRYDSANRDETKFENPNDLVFGRRGGHAAFGLGVHRCLGSNLARLQIEVAFDEMLKQIKNLRLAPDADVHWVAGIGNEVHRVDLEFDRLG